MIKIRIIFFILFLIFSHLIFSENLLSITFEKCNYHLFGKKIFSLKFESRYNIFNPSITKKDNKIVCCARVSTLTQRNLFYHLYGQIFYKSSIVFVEIENNKIIYPKLSGNLEDPRMIYFNDEYIVSMNNFVSKKDNFPILNIFDENYNLKRIVKYNKENYFGTNKISTQKNWCPFIHENKIYLHTDTFPVWKVFCVDIYSGNMQKIVEKEVYDIFPEGKYYLRCSTSWKSYDENNYICGLHTKTKGKIPTIRSLLVLIDKKSLLPISKTEIFCLEKEKHNRIQYLSGLETDDDFVFLAYGLNDAEMIIKKVYKKRLNFISCTA